jgi:hypothetical protein
MAYAIKDPIGGNLDRLQIIKGWLDGGGETHESPFAGHPDILKPRAAKQALNLLRKQLLDRPAD